VPSVKKTAVPAIKPRHFATAQAFGAWIDKNHERAPELWVGFWKKGCGRPSVDWPQAVREALRVGWIDCIRKSLSDEAYVIRFLPRRRGSVWSAINIGTAEGLIAEGLMDPNGLRAFEDRHANPGSGYRIAERRNTLAAAHEKRLRANRAAWAFWLARPPGYRRTIAYWVGSVKRAETQARRLEQLIDARTASRRIGD